MARPRGDTSSTRASAGSGQARREAAAGGEVKTLVGESPLEAVDSIEIKPVLVGKVVKVTIRGNEFKLEAGAGANAEGVVEAFEQRSGAAV